MDQYINLSYAVNPMVIGVLAASCVLSFLLFVWYWRSTNAKRKSAKSALTNPNYYAYPSRSVASRRSQLDASGSGGSAGGPLPSNDVTINALSQRLLGAPQGGQQAASPRNSSLGVTPTSTKSAPQARRPIREPLGTNFNDWGGLRVYGVDLGSYSLKGHCHRDGKMIEIAPRRSLVSVVEGGIVMGDVDVALENPDTSFFSLTRDLAASDTVVTLNNVTVRPYQALAGAIIHFINERPGSVSPIGVCVPPYLNHVAQYLYLTAAAANAQRFLIFSHGAACCASLLRCRQLQTKKQTHKPPRYVAMVDFGRSGVAAYVCDVLETVAMIRFQSMRSAGIQNMESRLVLELSSSLDDADGTLLARVIEAAKDIKEDFASVPEYLAATKRLSSVTLPNTSGVTVEITRENFDELCGLALNDLEETCQEVTRWIADNLPVSQSDVELHLIGNGFRYKPFRNVFEVPFDRRRTFQDQINVSQGLTQLILMRHPAFTGTRYEIDPLFELPTVEQSGLRRVEDVTVRRFGGGGLLSPRVQRQSSQLHVREKESDEQP